MTAPERFRAFVLARERARFSKELLGGNGPHSDDSIIAVNRFCNVNREDDAVTRWIKVNIRDRYARKSRTFMVTQVLAGRIFNEPETLAAVLPVEDIRKLVQTLEAMQAAGKKIMRGAYMVGAHGPKNKGIPVREYYARVLGLAQRLRYGNTLALVAEQLMGIEGVAEFMANQVCADLRYTRHFADAADWNQFVLCGPGTRRGLDRYINLSGPRFGNGSQPEYVERLMAVRKELRVEAFPLVHIFGDPNNLANCFCEWDKHERVLNGEVARLHTYL